MSTVYDLVGLASMLGMVGFAAGWLVGSGVVRWLPDKSRTGWIVAAVLVLVVLGIGLQQATAIRTVPRDAADARAHDYSLAALWVGLAIWATVVNAAGVVAGVRFPIHRFLRCSERPVSPPTVPPLHL